MFLFPLIVALGIFGVMLFELKAWVLSHHREGRYAMSTLQGPHVRWEVLWFCPFLWCLEMHLLWRSAGFNDPCQPGSQQQYTSRLIVPNIWIQSTNRGESANGFPFLFDRNRSEGILNLSVSGEFETLHQFVHGVCDEKWRQK